MKSISKFQLILLGIFAAGAVIGVAVLALSKSQHSSTPQTTQISVWGVMPVGKFNQLIATSKDNLVSNITYKQEDPTTIYTDYIEAVVDGHAPDAFILTQADIYKFEDKIYTLPFANYSQRTFQNSFVQGANIFLNGAGVEALPFGVDPLVMYWNRAMFTSIGTPQPPQYWDDIYPLIPKLTIKDAGGNITQSTVALGQYSNVTDAKEILSALIIQSGGNVTGQGKSTLLNRNNKSVSPTAAALNFYTQFSDPTKTTYSWNSSLPDSKTAFISGDLAIYFGLASELTEIKAKNPNLDFDVATLPQSRGGQPATYADYYVMAVSRNSPNITAALYDMELLSSAKLVTNWSANTGLPPVRNDLLSAVPGDAVSPIFYKGALWSQSWIDPDSAASDNILFRMVSAVTSGALSTTDAINRADLEMQGLFK